MKPSAPVLALALAASFAREAAGQVVTAPGLQVQPVVSGLSVPTTMAFVAPGDILVLQKNDGQVRRVRNGVLQPNPVLDFPVNADSERGLLGIAVNPTNPPRVFFYLTEAAADGQPAIANRVYSYTWNSGPGTLTNPRLVLDLPVLPGANHDGGVITIDAQGRLYAIIGDLNRNGQLQNNPGGAAPDDTSVVLRVNLDGTAASGNPFTPYCSTTTTTTCATSGDCPGGEACQTQVARYYAYGVRNSFGLSLDPVTGALWDTENGPSDYDEVNRIDPAFNSGWNRIMGPDARDPDDPVDLFEMPNEGSTYSDPEFSWLATVAPTAILFPRGLGPSYDNVAFVGDSNNGNLYSFPLNGARTGFSLAGGLADLVADDVTERNAVRIGSGFGGITDLKEGPDGSVYVVSIGAGAIYRISGPGRDFHTLTPCRVFDTRELSGPTLGAPLTCGTEQSFAVAGKCGVPSAARAVSLNLTGTASTAQGNLRLYPAGTVTPLVSTLNYVAGQTRANNAVAALGTDGQVSVLCSPSGTTHVIMDVNGYFR